ncbi:hypothetical protein PS934_04056 [Pseudomonas fluorescens]|uniref:hypothetical protein n=1 Tax=Pseudomonas fluorescens TaxID=294 RepID=UPI00123F65A1|nr:hypothetical protein [Pseudomonas fluorescens]VVQ14147.1 hypothetical protein PS934_04056 [Pseudomonas fluorescens]
MEKFNDNLAAIRTLNQIEAEQRRATPDQQALLARYVGWGGLASRCAACRSRPGGHKPYMTRPWLASAWARLLAGKPRSYWFLVILHLGHAPKYAPKTKSPF